MASKKLSRRDVLRGLGLAAAGAAATACQPKTVIVEVEKEVEKVVTQVVEVEKEVTKIVAGTPVVETIVETKVVEVVKEVTVAPTDIPDVNLWSNMIALVRPEGSHPNRYNVVQQHIMEQVGVKPIGNVPPPGDAGREKLNLFLSSRNLELDIFQGDWPTYKDAVIPLNDLLEQYGANILAAHTAERWAGMTDSQGNIWGVPRLGLMGHVHPAWFRQDWLDELGIDMPETWDDMEAAIEAFAAAKPDSLVAANGMWQLKMATVGGFTANGYQHWLDESDGKIKLPELQPGFQDWVAKMADWWDKGWFHKESFAAVDYDELFKSGNLGVHLGWYSRVTILAQRIILSGAVPGMLYRHSFLKGPEGWCMSNYAGMTSAKMITKKSQNPEAAIRLMNWQYDAGKDNVCTAVYGIKGEDWEWVDESDKYYVKRLNLESGEIYAGEFMCATGLGTDVWYAPDDDEWRFHYEHIRDYATDISHGKTAIDYAIPYDWDVIDDKAPGRGDIDRLVDEETVKFVTGLRPLSEWDDFLGQLDDAGLQDLIDAYTEQYNAATGS